jgi:hypothetical protein
MKRIKLALTVAVVMAAMMMFAAMIAPVPGLYPKGTSQNQRERRNSY